jgi:penicillin-binding protein 1A
VAVSKVVFPNGHVDHPEASKPQQAVSPAVAWEVTRLLHDNITEGTGTGAYTGCAGQAGKTGTTDEYTDAWFAGYQPNLATVVWVGYPESNDISMSSVHGTTVFGGTFPADIWHSLYSGAEVPCEEFEEPEQQISWSPFYGRYARSSPSDDATLNAGGGTGEGDSPPPGSAAVGGYDPDAYAPGAGQEPYPAPSPAPEDVGGGASSGR